MLYAALLRHQWLRKSRAIRSRHRWVAVLFFSGATLYLTLALFLLGFGFQGWVNLISPGEAAIGFLNRHLLHLFSGLLIVRFVSQRSIHAQVQPYLHLPIERARLVRFVHLAGSLSLHNLLPLLFFLPFWLRYVLPAAATPGALVWLGGVVLCLAGSQYGIVALRSLFSMGSRGALGTMVLLTGLGAIDELTGYGVVARTSTLLFGHLLDARLWPLAGLALGTAAVATISASLLHRQLRRDPSASREWGWISWQPSFSSRLGPAGNLAVLELTLMLRQKRPRVYLISAVVFALVYSTFLLRQTHLASEELIVLATLLSTGSFAFNYGQLMFSWESHYFDGLLSRVPEMTHMVAAKLMLLIVSCVLLFLVTLPVYLWLAPGFVDTHVAMFLYNTGVNTPLMMALAVNNRRHIDLSRSHLFNYEGFSMAHWLWFVLTMAPPFLLLHLLPGSQGLVAVGGIGFLGILSLPFLSRAFAQYLARIRYAMAAGFRQV